MGTELSGLHLQALTIYQRSLTTMQIQVQGLLQFAVPIFPTAKVRRGTGSHMQLETQPRPGHLGHGG